MKSPSSRPQRVLHICEPGLDGVFRNVQGIVHYLLEQGVTVDLAYSSVRGSEGLRRLVSTVDKAGGETLDMRVPNRPCAADLPAIVRLYRLAKKRRPDVIHSSSSKAGVLGRTLSLAGIPAAYVYTPHAYYGMGRSGARTAFYNAIERFFSRVGRTIHVSPDEMRFAREILRIDESKQNLIYNGADLKRFKPADAPRKRDARRRFGLPEQAVVLGTAARLVWQKDPHTLYRALEQIMPRHPQLWFLHLSSGGEYAEEIREWIKRESWGERVILAPYIEDASAFYDALDGFVLTSRFEGFPYVFVEALASDLPLVFTEFTGSSSIFDLQLSHCWHSPVEDAEGIAAALQLLVDDLATRRSGNHRQRAESHFDERQCFEQVLQLYRSLLR